MEGLTPLLIDAKREYVGQLTDALAPFVLNTVQGMYVAAATQYKGAATLAFQKALREIPGWNATVIATYTKAIEARYPFLADLIAACFVAYVKILSSVKLHQQKPNIRLRLPSNDAFVHKVYVHVAREMYSNPALIKADRAAKLGVVRAAVEASIRDQLPIEDILKAYLGNTVDNEGVNPAELADDEAPAAQLSDDEFDGGEFEDFKAGGGDFKTDPQTDNFEPEPAEPEPELKSIQIQQTPGVPLGAQPAAAPVPVPQPVPQPAAAPIQPAAPAAAQPAAQPAAFQPAAPQPTRKEIFSDAEDEF